LLVDQLPLSLPYYTPIMTPLTLKVKHKTSTMIKKLH